MAKDFERLDRLEDNPTEELKKLTTRVAHIENFLEGGDTPQLKTVYRIKYESGSGNNAFLFYIYGIVVGIAIACIFLTQD